MIARFGTVLGAVRTTAGFFGVGPGFLVVVDFLTTTCVADFVFDVTAFFLVSAVFVFALVAVFVWEIGRAHV